MKVTVEIADALLLEARELAAARNTTLRQIVEEGLLAVSAQQRPAIFKLRDGSFGANTGIQGPLATRWEDIRQAIYEGRGE